LPAASDISAGGVTSDNTLFETFTALGFDMQNLVVQLIPTNPGWVWVVSPPSGCATSTNYGTGCYKTPDSFYEYFATAAAMDLAGKTITMLRGANGYTVLDAIPGTLYPTTNAATQALGDDVLYTLPLSTPFPTPGGGTTSTINCSSNAVLTFEAANANGWTPAIPGFLAWAQTSIRVWHDYNNTIAGSGTVKFEEVGGFAYVTFDNVYSYGTLPTAGDTFQFQLNLSNGDVTLVFGTMTPAGNPYLVGYSVGGASADPGGSDLSSTAAYPINVGDVGKVELQLTSVGVPFLGNSAYALEVRNVPPAFPAAVVLFGSGQVPGIDLGPQGMPGCKQWSTIELGAFATLPTVGTTATIPFPMPANPSLVGALVTAQAAAVDPGANAFGVIASNGTELVVGG
jgi:hypothetical protein